MATEQLVPTGTITQAQWSSYALGNFDTDDTTWQDPSSNNVSPSFRVSFNTPTNTLTQGATDQTFNVKARKFETGQTGTPTIRLEVWETGGGALLAASSEQNLTGSEQTFSFTWDADILSNLDGSGCELYVFITKAGGGGSVRASGSVQYAEWVASYVVTSRTGSIASDVGSADQVVAADLEVSGTTASDIGAVDQVVAADLQVASAIASDLGAADQVVAADLPATAIGIGTIAGITVDDPIGWWSPSIDEQGNGSTTLTDLIGSNDGTLTNMETPGDWVSDTNNGGIRCLEFGGTDESADIGTGVLDFNQSSQSWSCSAWILTNDNGQSILGTGSVTGWWMAIADSSKLEIRIGTGVAETKGEGSTDIDSGNWHHIAFAFNHTADTFLGFVDGTEEITLTNTNTHDVGDNLNIGRVGASLFYTGCIDDVRVYDRALSGREIGLLAQQRIPWAIVDSTSAASSPLSSTISSDIGALDQVIDADVLTDSAISSDIGTIDQSLDAQVVSPLSAAISSDIGSLDEVVAADLPVAAVGVGTIAGITVDDPIGWWSPSIDEQGNGTTTLTDLIGSNDGTLTNMETPGDWVSDTNNGGVRCLDIGGTDEFVDVGDSVMDFHQGTTSWSCSAWVKTSTSSQYIIGAGGVTNGWFMAVHSDSTLRIRMGSSAIQQRIGSGSTNIADGSWHHVAFAFNYTADTFLGFVDGTEEITLDNTLAADIGDYLYIGRLQTGYYTGRIDDVRVYDRALSGREIGLLAQQRIPWAGVDSESAASSPVSGAAASDIGATDQVVATDAIATVVAVGTLFGIYSDDPENWWSPSLDEKYNGSATVMGDLVGSNNFTLWNIESGDWVSDTANGGIRALLFDGSNEWSATSSIDLTSTDVVSLSFWMHTTAFNDTDDVAFEFSNNFNNVTTGFYVNPNASSGYISVALKSDGGYNNANFTRPSANTWHHYVAEFDKGRVGPEVFLYIDGVYALPVSRPLSAQGTNNFGDHPLYMANRGGSSLFMQGKFDDIRLFERVLTADEVRRLATRRIPWSSVESELVGAPTVTSSISSDIGALDQVVAADVLADASIASDVGAFDQVVAASVGEAATASVSSDIGATDQVVAADLLVSGAISSDIGSLDQAVAADSIASIAATSTFAGIIADDPTTWFWPSLDDDNAGTTTIKDFGSNATNATYVGGDVDDWPSDTAFGGIRALKQDGGWPEYVDCNDTVLSGSGAFTASIWFKTTTDTSGEPLMTTGVFAAGTWFRLNLDASKAVEVNFGGSNTVEYGSGYNDGNWHHACVTKPSGGTVSGVKLYIDGTEVAATRNGSDTINISSSNNMYLMRESFAYLNGRIDDIRAYDRELSAREVGRLAAKRIPWVVVESVAAGEAPLTTSVSSDIGALDQVVAADVLLSGAISSDIGALDQVVAASVVWPARTASVSSDIGATDQVVATDVFLAGAISSDVGEFDQSLAAEHIRVAALSSDIGAADQALTTDVLVDASTSSDVGNLDQAVVADVVGVASAAISSDVGELDQAAVSIVTVSGSASSDVGALDQSIDTGVLLVGAISSDIGELDQVVAASVAWPIRTASVSSDIGALDQAVAADVLLSGAISSDIGELDQVVAAEVVGAPRTASVSSDVGSVDQAAAADVLLSGAISSDIGALDQVVAAELVGVRTASIASDVGAIDEALAANVILVSATSSDIGTTDQTVAADLIVSSTIASDIGALDQAVTAQLVDAASTASISSDLGAVDQVLGAGVIPASSVASDIGALNQEVAAGATVAAAAASDIGAVDQAVAATAAASGALVSSLGIIDQILVSTVVPLAPPFVSIEVTVNTNTIRTHSANADFALVANTTPIVKEQDAVYE
jgi:hypothetical protein